MAKATFDHCCCCIELRLGCFIMGYTEPIGYIYLIIKLVEMWKNVDNLIAMLKTFSVNLSDEAFEEVGRVLRAVVIGITIVIMLLSALKIFFTIILLIGLHKNKRGHVGAYLIYSAIFWVIGVFITISVIVKFANNEFIKLLREEDKTILMIMSYSYFIGIILLDVISIYFWMVIRSQYHKMPIDLPKKLINPVDTLPSPTISNVRPEGSKSQLSDEGSRVKNTNYSGQCTSPTDEGHPTLPASSDVRPEGPESQFSDVGSQDTSTDNHLKQSTSSENIEPADSPVYSVQPEEPTLKNSNEDSWNRDTNMADNSRQLASPVYVLPSTSSAPHYSFAAEGKTENGEFCEIELLPIPVSAKKNDSSVEIEQDLEKCKRE